MLKNWEGFKEMLREPLQNMLVQLNNVRFWSEFYAFPALLAQCTNP